MASFIETQRGGKKLLLEGFAYVHHKKLASGGNSWLCDQRNSMKCPGSIKTDSNGNPTTAVQHSHAASPTRLEVLTINNTIKTTAATARLPPRAIVNQSLEGISDSAKNIKGLLSEQVRVDTICAQLEGGLRVPMFSSQNYARANERLIELIRNYEQMHPSDFLKNCAYHVHFPA
ncbi:hypothetical protein niasHT_032999 [Heterodera trifolii]|uniref:FLYWCH-type domain-containing protein n=1 Tax=Heterodera trifolii TaxID=157864 RepID=A0ABD2IM20_9BILA